MGPVWEPPEYRSEQLIELTVARGVRRQRGYAVGGVGNPGRRTAASQGYPRSESLFLK